ncbi:MAG: alanine racemase [Candidatus Vogelbacteria bacterium]|nr:alanine racemase [Candidatus Vogelbacteria bacterium]
MKGLRTWIEIDQKAIKHNLAIFRSLINPKVKLMSVVKSNAYGHGLYDFTVAIDKLGADWFGVDSLIEGLALRREEVKKPILVLGFTLPERMMEAAENDVSITVSNFEILAAVAKRKSDREIKIHIKIDTGMHRQGFSIFNLPKVCKIIAEANKKGANIVVEGMYTHFAAAKNPSFPHETNKQIELFEEAIKIVECFGFKPIKHASATAGTLLFPRAHYDMVRIGIGLYGMWPSKEVERSLRSRFNLEPVMSWKTIIGEVKKLPEGGGVGYDLTERLPKNSKIAVCPVGYWHGYGRVFSSVGNVLVRGQRARVVGRVSMDMITIDVSKTKGLKVGDEVVIIGKQGKYKITADEMAFISDGVNYEIVTRTNPLIKRILV